jgi:hypothetical protein
MKNTEESYDVVVCGGGLAGLCAAVTAARHGAKTCVIQDRPVFGGNSSSEIRVTPLGAASFHGYARETGLISEWLIEERAHNHEPIIENGWQNSVWDLVLYDAVLSEPNLTFHLNSSVCGVIKSGERVLSAVVCQIANAETEITVYGKVFIDCTGDGLIAEQAGCEWRMGCEGRSEFNEPHAPLEATKDTMGSSIMFKAKDMGSPVPFVPPAWAIRYNTPSFFYEEGRIPNNVHSGYWWIEIGVPWNTIDDNETIRYELTRHVMGIWDWVKNRDPHLKDQAANFALEWIGQVPGKRESRRIMGDYLITEHDLLDQTVFPDEVAFGGWYIDLHTPGGLLAGSSEPYAAEKWSADSDYGAKSIVGPYGIPLRAMIAKDMDNLMMAGRNLSATHAALGSIRTQETTALLGQAVGTAAAVAIAHKMSIRQVPVEAIFEVQQLLLRDGCFLPNSRNKDPLDLAQLARVSASSTASLNGAGLITQGVSENLYIWGEKPEYRTLPAPLKTRHSQWIAIGTDKLNRLSVCLNNNSGRAQIVEARLVQVEHIWDYRIEPSPPLASTYLQVPVGKDQWVEWKLGLGSADGLVKGQYVRLDLLPNPQVEWCVSTTVETAHLAACEMAPGKLRRLRDGVSLNFRVNPPQPCYPPENVLSGVTRPYRFTNIWRSDPAEPLPQWLDLEWDTRQTIREVQLIFPGHLLREYRYYPPLFHDPVCPRDYAISARVDGNWVELARIHGNYQRLRRHIFPASVSCDQLRVTIQATNGDPSAMIFEVRCYA